MKLTLNEEKLKEKTQKKKMTTIFYKDDVYHEEQPKENDYYQRTKTSSKNINYSKRINSSFSLKLLRTKILFSSITSRISWSLNYIFASIFSFIFKCHILANNFFLSHLM